MPDENEQEEQHPYEVAFDRAEELGLEGEEKDDFIETRMRRAGYKRGPGAWIAVSDDDDDDDDENDDDDKPVTRGEIRRMNRERRKSANTNYTPPRKKKSGDQNEEGGKKPTKRDAWW